MVGQSAIVEPTAPATARSKAARNLWAASYLDSMLTSTRITRDSRRPWSWWLNLSVVLLFAPIGLLLALLRLGLVFPLIGLSHVLVPRRWQTGCFSCFSQVLFGTSWSVERKDEQQSAAKGEAKRPAIVVSNHTSEMDVLPIRATHPNGIRFVGYDFYTKMCWLRVSPIKFLDVLFISQESRSSVPQVPAADSTSSEGPAPGGNPAAGAASAPMVSSGRDKVREQVRAALAEEDALPLFVFPEGGLTNGRRALFQFHKFLFSLDEYAVQPIALRYLGGPLPLEVNCDMGTTWGNFFYYAFQPWHRYKVTFLPPTQRQPDESPLDFAQRVMAIIAAEEHIDSSPFMYRDKLKYLQLKMRLHREGFKFRFCSSTGPAPGDEEPTSTTRLVDRRGPSPDTASSSGNATVPAAPPAATDECVWRVQQSEALPEMRVHQGWCGGGAVREGMSPEEYLAEQLAQAFSKPDGTSCSTVFVTQ